MRGYLAAKDDPDLLSLEQELFALDALIGDRERRIGSGASPELLAACRAHVKLIRQARRDGDAAGEGRALAALLDAIDAGGREEDSQNSVIALYEKRSKLVDAQVRHLTAAGAVMTLEQALIMMRTWEDLMRRYVKDPADLRAFDREVQAILDGKPGRPTIH
jgi:hypothetical protein